MGEKLVTYPLSGGINSFNITNQVFAQGVYFYKTFTGKKLIASDKIIVIK